MPDTPPDADIAAMQRLAADDDLALNDLMHRWKDKVAAFLLRMTGNAATAVDLTQETFVKLFQSRARYRPTAPFPTYLFRIASNLARNHARWNQRHPTVSRDNEDDHVPESVEPQPGPDEQMERSEKMQRVEAALAALPEDLREAMLLFTYQDMSYAEIAAAVGCTSKAVETRIYRARQILRAALGGSQAD
ncbi:sigma-70 family RNA polymerase sigma factor [Prosthecobacter sp.]|uniref:RNA polymerase sigma factor n=1 Tax=Prosthecobacter sp. TaxID=1965333 RepID=UPI002489FD1A|nr:sigma-70 family RNA polymerase sigma factor [Prosthecobacter sp.]MDI1311901.1 sigma-70 family RNA polymerase sigma factor [Prosthecobacter sp.]